MENLLSLGELCCSEDRPPGFTEAKLTQVAGHGDQQPCNGMGRNDWGKRCCARGCPSLSGSRNQLSTHTYHTTSLTSAAGCGALLQQEPWTRPVCEMNSPCRGGCTADVSDLMCAAQSHWMRFCAVCGLA